MKGVGTPIKLNKGMNTVYNKPEAIILEPNVSAQITDSMGESVMIDNKTSSNKKIMAEKLISSNAIKDIKSIRYDDGDMVEGFGKRRVKDTCHYVCSSINNRGILICALFIIIIYYCVAYFH